MDQHVAGPGRVDDRVDPEPGGGVADVGLAVVAPAQLLGHRRQLGVVDLLALALEGRDVDVEHRPRRLLRAHHGVPGRRPGEEEPRVERPAAEGVMARAEGVADDQRELGHRAVAHGVDQLGPAADDPAALGVAADVEAVDVLDEQDRQPRPGCSRGRTARPCRRCRRRSRRRTGTGRPPRAGTGAAGWPRSPARSRPAGRTRRRASGRTRRGTRRAGRRRAAPRAGRARRTAPRGPSRTIE